MTPSARAAGAGVSVAGVQMCIFLSGLVITPSDPWTTGCILVEFASVLALIIAMLSPRQWPVRWGGIVFDMPRTTKEAIVLGALMLIFAIPMLPLVIAAAVAEEIRWSGPPLLPV